MELPEPLTNTSHDVSGLDGFMLNTDKLMASELVALATGEEFKAAVCLWCRAWKQVPAGSLPNETKVLAAFSGAGFRWPKVKDVALRGFILCSDGRLYHKTLCEDVHRAAASKALRRERTKAATEARKNKRDEQRDVSDDDERDVEQSSNVTTSHRQDRTGQEEEKGRVPQTPIDGFIEDWNRLAAKLKLPKVQRLTETRKSKFLLRLADIGGPPGWPVLLEKIENSRFLSGKSSSFCVTFDWVLNPTNLTKIMEGNYDERPNGPPKNDPSGIQSAIDDERSRVREGGDDLGFP